MKILYLIPSFAAGLMGNRIHVEVIEEWRNHGVEAEVLTLAAGLREQAVETVDGITVHRLPVNRSLGEKALNRAVQALVEYPYWLGALARYRSWIARHGSAFDLVHVETAFPLGALGALMTDRRQPPLAVTLQGADVMAEPAFDYGYGRFAAVRLLLRQVFRKARLLRADAPMIARLVATMGADPRKTISIPFNITDASFPPGEEPLESFRARARDEICRRHGLQSDKPLLMSISRLHPFKGVEFLVEALPVLRDSVGPVQAIIGGPNRVTPRFGDYGAYLQKRAEELGVENITHFVGMVDNREISRYWAAADIVVVPSVVESLNRVSAEAAAVGTPTVVTRTTGVSEYVARHGCGEVVEPRSGEAIAHAAARLLDDRSRWEQQSARGAGLANEFRSSTVARELLLAYQGVLGSDQKAQYRSHTGTDETAKTPRTPRI